MKISPIINILAKALPFFTDRFSDTQVINAITCTAGIATATTALPHNLSINDIVTVTDAIQTVQITSIVVAGGVGTIHTASDHGMVLNFDFKDRTLNTVLRIRGSSGLINGDFEVLDVPNRYYATFSTSLSNGTYPHDGVVLNYAFNVFNGTHTVLSVPSATTFTYAVDDATIIDSTVGTSTLHTVVRITGAADIGRAQAHYSNYENTGYTENKYYAYVTAGTTVTSKDRRMLNDSIHSTAAGTDPMFYVVEDFDVNIFCPTSTDQLCVDTRDALEDIKIALFNTLLGVPQPMLYTTNVGWYLSFVGDFAIAFDRAGLTHGYRFQTMYEVNQGDMAKFGDLAPFRNLGLNMSFGVTSDSGYKNVNLDQNPDFTG